MSTFKHIKTISGCPRCLEIFDTYPGVDKDLKRWFFTVQKSNGSFHISEAGRGKTRQNLLYTSGSSKAQWLESAHNYNCAIDTFFLDASGKLTYDKNMYTLLQIPAWIDWYGAPGSKFYERPHMEIRGWKLLNKQGKLTAVEK